MNTQSPIKKFTTFFLLAILWGPLWGDLVWPTPNSAFQRGESIEAFVQPTVSGKIESGLFGCVRNSGAKFHEGLDLYPIERDKKGEALDHVYSILSGRVVHVSRVAGRSSYGRYVVVEHDEEPLRFHTLYAHLASVPEEIGVGTRVEAGSVLGRMGRSAGGYSIPKERSHLHFEMGLRLTDSFQEYYDARGYGSRNWHGIWNGMNLVSIDPLDFYRQKRKGAVHSFSDYLAKLPVVARIRVFSSRKPSFVLNYPELLTQSYEGKTVEAWDIAFTEFGVPKEWTPRFASEKLEGEAGNIKVIAYDPQKLMKQSCRSVIELKGKNPRISSSTVTTIKKLFGFN